MDMMTKNTPKPQRKSAKRTATAAKRPSGRKKKPQTSRFMSVWLRNVLAVAIILVFSAGFYWFFVRPYAYRWKPCHGQRFYGVCMPCDYEVHGIDISHYQGDIDWGKLVNSRSADFPIQFVFMKATEGGDYGDDKFAHNFDLAHRHGLIRGAYHFFIPQTDPVKQADFFIRTVRLTKGDLPPVLDVETTGRKSVSELQKSVKTWLDRVEAHYGVKPILYASYKFKERYLNDSIFNTYPYWIAHYYVDSVRYTGPWHFWQHTDVGQVPGIEEDVDLNVFNGTLEELVGMTLP